MKFDKMIGVDWGNSYLRVFLVSLVSNDAKIIRFSSSKQGILYIENHFDEVLEQHLKKIGPVSEDWPIIMCGMIGSNKGWLETPYLQCPVLAENFALQLQTVIDNSNSLKNQIFIVPGLKYISTAGQSDFIRGEETQILGALYQTNHRETLFCLPGTHSKWALVNDKTITAFRTYMTGEIYQLLNCYPTSLMVSTKNSQVSNTFNQSDFKLGLDQSRQNNSLLYDLFQTRVGAIEGRLANIAARIDFLSGLLIGSEIQDALSHHSDDVEIHLIADSLLATRYCLALNYFGRNCKEMNSHKATIAGLIEILNYSDFT